MKPMVGRSVHSLGHFCTQVAICYSGRWLGLDRSWARAQSRRRLTCPQTAQSRISGTPREVEWSHVHHLCACVLMGGGHEQARCRKPVPMVVVRYGKGKGGYPGPVRHGRFNSWFLLFRKARPGAAALHCSCSPTSGFGALSVDKYVYLLHCSPCRGCTALSAPLLSSKGRLAGRLPHGAKSLS